MATLHVYLTGRTVLSTSCLRTHAHYIYLPVPDSPALRTGDDPEREPELHRRIDSRVTSQHQPRRARRWDAMPLVQDRQPYTLILQRAMSCIGFDRWVSIQLHGRPDPAYAPPLPHKTTARCGNRTTRTIREQRLRRPSFIPALPREALRSHRCTRCRTTPSPPVSCSPLAALSRPAVRVTPPPPFSPSRLRPSSSLSRDARWRLVIPLPLPLLRPAAGRTACAILSWGLSSILYWSSIPHYWAHGLRSPAPVLPRKRRASAFAFT
ncbi:hypothetical protein B0H13DRAFT_2513773 [Mycena leptocephala]|nr:hypothetical protein B0H13DRAFT_2513773 [Mycena leptocephala]